MQVNTIAETNTAGLLERAPLLCFMAMLHMKCSFQVELATVDSTASCSRRLDKICSSLNLLLRIVRLPAGVKDSTQIWKGLRVSGHDRETAHAAIVRTQGANRGPIVIPGERIAAIGQMMRERLTTGDVPFRKAYLGAIIDRVEVDDTQIRIRGRKDVLEQVVLANGTPAPGFATL